MTDTTLSAGGPAATPQARTRIKLCGLSRPADVDHAVALGADAVGFVFYPKSPRAVSIAQAAELVRRVPPFVSAVGLFVNAAPGELARVLDAVPLTTLQFHGDETPEQCEALAREARLPWMRALRVGASTQRADLVESATSLFDSQRPVVRHPCAGLRRQRQGLRLVTYSRRARASGRFEWWLERAKRR